MNGPTMWRRVYGSTRPTSKPPRSRRRWSMISMSSVYQNARSRGKSGRGTPEEGTRQAPGFEQSQVAVVRRLPWLGLSRPPVSQGLQEFHQVRLLARRQSEREVRIVVVDHRGERRESPVVVEAAL